MFASSLNNYRSLSIFIVTPCHEQRRAAKMRQEVNEGFLHGAA